MRWTKFVSVERAITNSERANQLIATADSGLGQVSSLLNDIRALVSEAANTGALSEEQISAKIPINDYEDFESARTSIEEAVDSLRCYGEADVSKKFLARKGK